MHNTQVIYRKNNTEEHLKKTNTKETKYFLVKLAEELVGKNTKISDRIPILKRVNHRTDCFYCRKQLKKSSSTPFHCFECKLGLVHKNDALEPTQIKLEFPVEDISKIRLAFGFSSILTNDRKLYVTGSNSLTGFGSDLTEFKQYPQFKNNNTIIKDIDCGYELFAILTQDNEIWFQGIFGGFYTSNSSVIRKIQSGNNLTNDLSTYNQIKCWDQNLIFFLKSNSYLSQDLEKLLKNGYFSDFNIQNIPVHKILIETRIGKTFDLIKKYLESNCKLNEIQDLLKWIYCDQMINSKRTNEILNHFGIQDTQITKLVKNDLKQLLFDEQTSDFKLVVKNEED
ncbi:secretion-regulating guanine nucleotide exchange factor [Anaeramoeba flamelloides]|uniref:Secretion-regulating guanine nucleotide exchange factor n=1 Tax=Anaeramoeba flamelloides TaxID=1746091 RepID=A0AAV8A649_9EUKA|nr:secretion-regulating guanine nucleotide exchange factor [Anaeramoeba flamelloides]